MADLPETPIIIPPPPPPPNPLTESIVVLNLPISTKLNRSNYLAWKSQIEPVLLGHGLHRYLISPPPPATITISNRTIDNPAYKQDQLLLGWLRSSLSDTLLSQVVNCFSSFAFWSNLQHTFSATSRARLAELRRTLQTTVKGSSSCSDYFEKMQAIADELGLYRIASF